MKRRERRRGKKWRKRKEKIVQYELARWGVPFLRSWQASSDDLDLGSPRSPASLVAFLMTQPGSCWFQVFKKQMKVQRSCDKPGKPTFSGQKGLKCLVLEF